MECFVTASVPPVVADKEGIERVVLNILSNAIKYTPDNGVIKVYVGFVYNDAYIKIIDNGIGIPKEDITIILSVPVDISQKLMTSRYNGDNSKKDIHEADVKYLKDCYFAAHDAYKYLKSKGYAWDMIHCETVLGDNIKSIEAIHVEIIQKLKELSIIE